MTHILKGSPHSCGAPFKDTITSDEEEYLVFYNFTIYGF